MRIHVIGGRPILPGSGPTSYNTMAGETRDVTIILYNYTRSGMIGSERIEIIEPS